MGRISSSGSLGRLGAGLMLAFIGLLVASCHPLYGPTSSGADHSYELASVDIQPIPGRVGQRVRNELIFLFTGGGLPAEPQYRLEIALRESEQGVLFKRNEDTSGMIYSLDATYVLRDASGKHELTHGGSHARAAFDKVDSTFANIRAKKDAEDRAARDIARDINNRIAAWIAANR